LAIHEPILVKAAEAAKSAATAMEAEVKLLREQTRAAWDSRDRVKVTVAEVEQLHGPALAGRTCICGTTLPCGTFDVLCRGRD